MTTQTPARSLTALRSAPATGATGDAGWGSPSVETQRRQPPVAPAFDLARGRLPWLTVRFSSTGHQPRPTSPAHPGPPTKELRAEHRAAGPGASCAREHRRGRAAPETRGRGGP